MKPINIGLIGAGGRLRGVIKRLLAADSENRIRVAAVHDPDLASHRALQEAIGHDYLELSEDELIHNPDIDWVFIGSWNCHHARQAIKALEAGKDVFCEKPLATNLADCLAIRDAVKQSGRAFFFGLVLRYSPHYQKIKELVGSDAIGKLVSFEFNETLNFDHGGYIFGNWRRDPDNAGSHILEKCCHDLDLANWITESLPVRVASFGGKNFFLPENRSFAESLGKNAEGRDAYVSWKDPHRKNPFDGQAAINDNQVVILEYASGCRASFHTNCNSGLSERRFYLCGTRGTLRGDLARGEIELRRIGWETTAETFRKSDRDLHGGGDQVMSDALLETLVYSALPLASIDEGIKSAIVAFAIDQAEETGKIVDLMPMWKQAGIDPRRKEEPELVGA